MALPIGTTARNLESIGRWMLVGVVVCGMGMAWWPGYAVWGALSMALLVVWTVWLLWRTVGADRSVPAHPAYLVLAGPAIILMYHAGRTGLGAVPQHQANLGGALDMSMLFHLWLLATGILLCQSLLGRITRHRIVVSICGAAMMCGAVLAVAFGRSEPVCSALGFVGFAGVAVWLSPLWMADMQGTPITSRIYKSLRLARLAAAAVASAALAWLTPVEAVVSIAVAGAVVSLAMVIRARGRMKIVAIAACIALMLGLSAWGLAWWSDLPTIQVSAFGQGEGVFVHLSARDPSLAILAGAIGWVGLAWLAVGVLASVVYLLVAARKQADRSWPGGVVWIVAAMLAGCAMLTRAGLSVPSVTLAVAFTWGVLPPVFARPERRRSGAVVLIALVVLLAMLGLARHGGLPGWASLTMSGGNLLHPVTGFFMGLVLAWLMGSRSVALGLGALALAALAGGAGEALQKFASQRNVEMSDWIEHAIGTAVALPLYLLCIGSRGCESPDARPPGDLADRPNDHLPI